MTTPATRAMRITVSGNREDKIMTTPLRNLIRITDDQGVFLLLDEDGYEPMPGSIVMTDGQFGTAWQKHFNDGLWHRCGSTQKKDWAYLLTKRNLVLVYDAEQREAS